MNTDVGIKFNNTYKLELVDSTTGALKQQGTFHNTVTSLLYRALLRPGSSMTNPFITRMIACGSGTTVTPWTTTTMTSYLWQATVVSADTSYEWVDDNTLRARYKATFPATSSYVGVVTEVGMGNGATGNMYTHALLTDSEGSLISFTKTDLDVLVVNVTVEMSLESTSSNFKLFKKPNALYMLYNNYTSGSRYYTFGAANGLPSLCRYDKDIETFFSNAGYNISSGSAFTAQPCIDQAINLSSASYATDGTWTSSFDQAGARGTVTLSPIRLKSEFVTSERYYKYIALPGLGYWELPNQAVFPAYTIQGISIGTGDGSKTAFTNPLSYFKSGTDKVYKNGTLLTRGVDYTINNIGNAKCLPELSQFMGDAKVTSTLIDNVAAWRTGFYQEVTQPLFRCHSLDLGKKPSDVDKTKDAFGFDNNNPIIIEYDDPVTANCLSASALTCLYYYAPSYSYNVNIPANTKIMVDYSTDGASWSQCGEYTITTASDSVSFMLDFDEHTAKYWRVRTNLEGVRSGSYYYALGITNKDGHILLNHKNPNITFTTAPAAGDVLTMDADMDLIMKNSNFVVDCSMTINYSFNA